MRKLQILVSMALLSGCASTQEVLSQSPDEVVTSTKPPVDVAFCLANKNNVAALDSPQGGKVILVKNGYGGVGMSFTVLPDGTGSKIEIRRPFEIIGVIHRQCY